MLDRNSCNSSPTCGHIVQLGVLVYHELDCALILALAFSEGSLAYESPPFSSFGVCSLPGWLGQGLVEASGREFW